MTNDPDCIFCKIVRGEIPARKVHEDEHVLAFHDVRPQAPVHLLVIPKAHFANLYEAEPRHREALGALLQVAGELARREGAGEGFRCIINNGRAAHQEVYHLHMHVLGGPEPLGPMLQQRRK